jgi:hypothetical protein
MASYEVTLKAGTTEEIANADAYQQEGPMTTFFRITSGRQVVDSWSIRLASFRTTDVVAVRRHESEMTATASMPSLRSA